MDGLVDDPLELFPELFKHLQDVKDHPNSILLNEELLKRGERAIDVRTPRDLLWRLLSTGENLLQELQYNPEPLTRLLERVIEFIPLDELRSVISAEKLEEGILSPSKPIQLLCIAYLRKAADSPSGASFVACHPSLVKKLVTTWLAAENIEVSDRAIDAMMELLDADHPENITTMLTSLGLDEAEGHGLFWRRIFRDPEVYSLLFQWTSLVKSNHDVKTKKGWDARSVSQARLFDFIARVAALDWAPITTTIHADIEKEYSHCPDGKEGPYGGLLRYAANGMIDKDDYLMEVLREQLFKNLAEVAQTGQSRAVSPKLLTAIQEGAGLDPSQAGIQ